MQSGYLLYNSTLRPKRKNTELQLGACGTTKAQTCVLCHTTMTLYHTLCLFAIRNLCPEREKRRLSDIDVIIIDRIPTFYIRKK